MLKESLVCYRDKLHRYQELLDRQKILDQKYRQKVKKYYKAINIIEYLKENSYFVDPRLAECVNELEKPVQEWTSVFNDVIQLEGEIHPGNFRHVVYSLANEIGLSLRELAQNLNCSTENVLVDLCEKGSINKLDYQKLCNYFGLDGDLWGYHYVYPKTEYAISNDFCK